MMQISDALKGAVYGAALGGLGGLGACMWLIPDDLSLFPGDTILIGAIICGFLGFIFGERFFDFLSDHWHWF